MHAIDACKEKIKGEEILAQQLICEHVDDFNVDYSWSAWQFEHYESKPQELSMAYASINPKALHDMHDDKENMPNQKKMKPECDIKLANNALSINPLISRISPKRKELVVVRGDTGVQVKHNKKFPEDVYSPR